MLTIDQIALQIIEELDARKLKETMKSNSTLIVDSQTPAIEVATMHLIKPVTTIAVKDYRDEIKGLVFPQWIRNQVASKLDVEVDTFRDAVMALQNHTDNILMAGAGNYFERPVLFWCLKGNHYTDKDPCDFHSS